MKGKLGKTGIICLALVLALGTLGVAFAYWTETLTITGQVNTGELKVVFIDMHGGAPSAPAQVFNEYGIWAPPGDTHYLPLSDDTFTLSLRNMFPGVGYTVNWLRARNAGTIPAKIKSVTLNNLSDPGNIKGYVEWHQTSPVVIIRADGTKVKLGNFVEWTPIAEVPGKYYDILKGYVLYPGDMLKFDAEEPEEYCFRIRLSPDAPNNTEGCTITFDIVFTWTQFNAPN